MSIEDLLNNPYDDEPFGSDEERKAKNRENNRKACGKRWSFCILPDGTLKKIVTKCHDYRLCDNCRYEKFEQEIEPRLNHAQLHMELGGRPRFLTITEDKRKTYFRKLTRGGFDYYCFPQPDDELIVVHNDPDGDGDELWDFGYDDNDRDWETVIIKSPSC